MLTGRKTPSHLLTYLPTGLDLIFSFRFLEVFACSLVLMLFFRSGKASQLDGFCDQCRQRRKKRFVHPKAEGAIPPDKAVQGIAWRQSSETEMTDVK